MIGFSQGHHDFCWSNRISLYSADVCICGYGKNLEAQVCLGTWCHGVLQGSQGIGWKFILLKLCYDTFANRATSSLPQFSIGLFSGSRTGQSPFHQSSDPISSAAQTGLYYRSIDGNASRSKPPSTIPPSKQDLLSYPQMRRHGRPSIVASSTALIGLGFGEVVMHVLRQLEIAACDRLRLSSRLADVG